MTGAPILTEGAARFVADLEEEGLEPAVRGDVVTYYVVPATGARAGQRVHTGVSLSELQGWPMAPPHWVHLPVDIDFAHTNADTQGCLEGWRRHSRDTSGWDMNRKPIMVWLGHIRCVLGQVA